MSCPTCGTENAVGAKFCNECGSALASGCPTCGTQNAPGSRFCNECGTTLTGAVSARAAVETAATADGTEPAGGSTSERRLVSVLFADLVGSTTLAEDQDPEETRELLSRYFDAAREVIDRYGGTIEKFIGDAVMAVWGVPTAHEDDAERAVRAGLDLVEAVAHLEGATLQARAGVLTGEAAATVGATGQGIVAGDLVNTASRLQSVAPPGSVLVGEPTYHATREAIRYEEAGEQLLKGKTAPVSAWRAMAVTGLRGGAGRSTALEAPFVGRDDDLRLVKDLFEATVREGKPRLVTVIGQAGIGKSRLGWEFEKYIDGVVGGTFWHEGRSPAYGEGISFWALGEMVRFRAGIADGEDPDVARERLRASVDEFVTDADERRWIEPRLAGLLGLEELPAGQREELFAAWRTFFERMAQQDPVCLVFTDLHWADAGLLDFIEHLLDWAKTSPIFVLALTRPELYERRPGWGSGVRSATSVTLEPLPDPVMRELLHGLAAGLPESLVTAVCERAGGIPLYAVETVRMLIDRGQLVPAGDGFALAEGADQLDRLAVPETLHALIAARLDANSRRGPGPDQRRRGPGPELHDHRPRGSHRGERRSARAASRAAHELATCWSARTIPAPRSAASTPSSSRSSRRWHTSRSPRRTGAPSTSRPPATSRRSVMTSWPGCWPATISRRIGPPRPVRRRTPWRTRHESRSGLPVTGLPPCTRPAPRSACTRTRWR